MSRRVWGILGGLGPLASNEFMHNIHSAKHASEQRYPSVVLASFPDIPDRTAALNGGQTEQLAARLNETLERLLDFGATDLIMCCFTAHSVLPLLSARVQDRLHSLPELGLQSARASVTKSLLLCTLGARASGVFTAHPIWAKAQGAIVLPSESDLARIHDFIYAIKRGEPIATVARAVETMAEAYGCGGLLLGCTEFHLFSRLKHDSNHLRNLNLHDPLWDLVKGISA